MAIWFGVVDAGGGGALEGTSPPLLVEYGVGSVQMVLVAALAFPLDARIGGWRSVRVPSQALAVVSCWFFGVGGMFTIFLAA